MITNYLDNRGRIVIIKKMHDSHLLNAYAYYKKRKEIAQQESFISEYDIELQNRTEALENEIKRRKLL